MSTPTESQPPSQMDTNVDKPSDSLLQLYEEGKALDPTFSAVPTQTRTNDPTIAKRTAERFTRQHGSGRRLGTTTYFGPKTEAEVGWETKVASQFGALSSSRIRRLRAKCDVPEHEFDLAKGWNPFGKNLYHSNLDELKRAREDAVDELEHPWDGVTGLLPGVTVKFDYLPPSSTRICDKKSCIRYRDTARPDHDTKFGTQLLDAESQKGISTSGLAHINLQGLEGIVKGGWTKDARGNGGTAATEVKEDTKLGHEGDREAMYWDTKDGEAKIMLPIESQPLEELYPMIAKFGRNGMSNGGINNLDLHDPDFGLDVDYLREIFTDDEMRRSLKGSWRDQAKDFDRNKYFTLDTKDYKYLTSFLTSAQADRAGLGRQWRGEFAKARKAGRKLLLHKKDLDSTADYRSRAPQATLRTQDEVDYDTLAAAFSSSKMMRKFPGEAKEESYERACSRSEYGLTPEDATNPDTSKFTIGTRRDENTINPHTGVPMLTGRAISDDALKRLGITSRKWHSRGDAEDDTVEQTGKKGKLPIDEHINGTVFLNDVGLSVMMTESEKRARAADLAIKKAKGMSSISGKDTLGCDPTASTCASGIFCPRHGRTTEEYSKLDKYPNHKPDFNMDIWEKHLNKLDSLKDQTEGHVHPKLTNPKYDSSVDPWDTWKAYKREKATSGSGSNVHTLPTDTSPGTGYSLISAPKRTVDESTFTGPGRLMGDGTVVSQGYTHAPSTPIGDLTGKATSTTLTPDQSTGGAAYTGGGYTNGGSTRVLVGGGGSTQTMTELAPERSDMDMKTNITAAPSISAFSGKGQTLGSY